MTIEMKRDEFDGKIRIVSNQPLELQSTVTVKNLKGENVERFIVSRQGEFRGEYTYNYAKDRQSWLDAERREAGGAPWITYNAPELSRSLNLWITRDSWICASMSAANGSRLPILL